MGRTIYDAFFCYAAMFSSSQPGKTRTAGWQFSALARILARSTSKLARLFSIADMVDCGMLVSAAS